MTVLNHVYSGANASKVEVKYANDAAQSPSYISRL